MWPEYGTYYSISWIFYIATVVSALCGNWILAGVLLVIAMSGKARIVG